MTKSWGGVKYLTVKKGEVSGVFLPEIRLVLPNKIILLNRGKGAVMKKTDKKGFTIVELVIVIAVVAILAAVLIPTFVNVVKKANVSNDTALVKNINTTLATEEVEDGKPATMYDALKMAENGGFDVSKLTPRSSGEIVWDEETNRFALIDGNKTVFAENGKTITESSKIWKFVSADNLSENTGYGSYITGAGEIETLTVSAGIDVGNNTVKTLNYENTGSGQTVTIRTNGGALVVDAVSDTVNHYGEVDSVNIKAVAENSYHEHGTVNGDVIVTKGHVSLESSAVVGTIKVAETAVANEVKVSNNSDKAIVVVDSDNKLSSDSDIGSSSVSVTDKDAVAIIGNVSYNNLKEAFAAAKDGDTVKLIADYRMTKENTSDTVDDRLMIKSKITFDFGEYKIIGFTEMGSNNTNFTAIIVCADSTFVAGKNGGIISDDVSNGGGYGINIINSAKLTIKSGTYLGGGTAVQVQEGTLEILGGKFLAHPYDKPYGYKFIINAIDDAYKDGTAIIKIYGGSFYKFDPADSESENPHASFLSEGYTTEKSADEWYTVVPNK